MESKGKHGMKPSEWITKYTDSHLIQNHEQLAAKWREEIGTEAPWQYHTVAQARRNIEKRGLGGNCDGPEGKLVCYGYEVAGDIARHYGVKPMFKYGRGSAFWAAIEALQGIAQ
jgi:hypothetical protein